MPRPTARTELVIQGQNRTAGAFGQVDAGIVGLIGSLGKLRTVALAGAAAFGAFQLTRIINESVDAIDRLDRLSKQMGVSVGFVQELQYAARLTGSDLETFADAVLDIEERLADAASGNKTYIEAFERIGLEVRELRRLRPEERFKAIAKGIAELNTEYERILAIRELGSDSATVLLNYFEDGAEGIDKMSKAFADLGVELDDYQIKRAKEAKIATVNLTTAFRGLKNELVTGVAPALTAVAEAMSETISIINLGLTDLEKYNEKRLHRQRRTLEKTLKRERENLEKLQEEHKAAEAMGKKFTAGLLEDYISASRNKIDSLERTLEEYRKLSVSKTKPDSESKPSESKPSESESFIVKESKGMGVLAEAIHDAIVAGGKRGSEAMVDTFLDTVRSRLVNQLADMVTGAIFGPKAGAKNAEQAKRGGLFGILQQVNSVLSKKEPSDSAETASLRPQSLLPQSQGGLCCMPGQSPIRTALGGLGGIFKGLGKLLGFEHGGSFMVGGAGGPDSSLVAFRATPGERVSVQTPQQQSTMGNVQVTISNHVTVRGSDAEALRFAKVVSEATEARIIEARRRGRY